MTTLVGTRVVTLNGMPLFGTDSDGAEWVVEVVEGWEAADMRLDLEQRPGQHGAFDPEPLFTERKMVIRGSVWAPSRAALRGAEDDLMRLTSQLRGVPMQVDESPFSRFCTVWRSGQATFEDFGQFEAVWTIPVVAPDPTRYFAGTPDPVILLLPVASLGHGYDHGYPYGYGAGGAGDRVLVNQGDATVWPTLRIDGPVANPVIRNDTTGEVLTLSITLAAGEWLDIDAANETVLLNGTSSRRRAVTSGSLFLSLPPGSSLWQFRADTYSPDARVTATYRSGST